MSHRETAVSLFVDTNALVAAFNEDDEHHEAADTVLELLGRGDLPYGPLFTSRCVLSETATTMLVGIGHREAVEALQTVLESDSFNILTVDGDIFERTVAQFEQYDDQTISFIDHMNGVLAAEYGIEHVFTFDSDFATLGLTRVPVDTHDI